MHRIYRTLACSLLAAALAAPAPAQGQEPISRAEAIAVVKSIMARGMSCGYSSLTVTGYKADGSPGYWHVHVAVTSPAAGPGWNTTIDYLVRSPSEVEPEDVAADEILDCAGGVDVPVPVVKAFVKKGAVKPASRITLEYAVKDPSGKATVHINLLEGGEWLHRVNQTVKATSLTARHEAEFLLQADLTGPLMFCVWAENAAKGRSKGAPKSSCARIAMVVDIDRISNGCGGKGWESIEAIENAFGNTSTYEDASGSYTVNFTRACDIHDAGYGGYTIRDPLHQSKLVDFQKWTRKQVDDKFRKDIALLCEKTIKVPPAQAETLAACKDNFRYRFVRRWGDNFFDANLMKPGVQDTGGRDNG